MDYTIDAKNKRLGRLATEVATILQGKHRPDFDPSKPGDDRVIIANPGSVEIGGNKATGKVYYRHTGYMGHLKERTYAQAFAKDPREVIREAVRRMLPKNFLNQRRLTRLTFTDHE